MITVLTKLNYFLNVFISFINKKHHIYLNVPINSFSCDYIIEYLFQYY